MNIVWGLIGFLMHEDFEEDRREEEEKRARRRQDEEERRMDEVLDQTADDAMQHDQDA